MGSLGEVVVSVVDGTEMSAVVGNGLEMRVVFCMFVVEGFGFSGDLAVFWYMLFDIWNGIVHFRVLIISRQVTVRHGESRGFWYHI